MRRASSTALWHAEILNVVPSPDTPKAPAPCPLRACSTGSGENSVVWSMELRSAGTT
jgi:hypothetical protein